jgi:hypothetical protein
MAALFSQLIGTTHEESSKECFRFLCCVSYFTPLHLFLLLSPLFCLLSHLVINLLFLVVPGRILSPPANAPTASAEAVHTIVEGAPGQHWVARLILTEGTPLLITIRIIDTMRLFLVHRGSCHLLYAG